jgi:acetoin utilization deacetylase AcuC-like enzyme
MGDSGSMPAPIYLHHRSSLDHETEPHPEQPARIIAIERELASRDWLGFDRVESPPVQAEDLLAVHPLRYVRAIEERCLAGGGALDLDTVVSEGSWTAALHAAGGAVALVDALLDGTVPTGISAHRPPGHHAEPMRAMGFCLFNNAAVAARHAVRVRGLERVLILDWDVHHGNGTNDIFRTEPQVLYVSLHEYPLYPGTGAPSDRGDGPGRGYTLNLPVPGGSGDDVWTSLVEHVAVPRAREFAPQLVLISAGFDAHAADPLATCRVTEAGYATMAASMRRLAAEVDAPLGIVLEGGYHLEALARSLAVTLEVTGSPSPPGLLDLPVHPLAERAQSRLSEV